MTKHWGVWMRLAVVVTALWLAAAPITFWLSSKGDWANGQEVGRQSCFNTILTPVEESDRCLQIWAAADFPDGQALGLGFLAALAAAAVVWLLAFAIRAIARWVLAGRSAPQ